MSAEIHEVAHAGKTALQIKIETEGTKENIEWKKGQLHTKMLPLRKRLIQLKMDAVKKRFNESEKAVHKAVDSISSMDDLKRQLKALGFEGLRSEA